jgi:hypothetical protein
VSHTEAAATIDYKERKAFGVIRAHPSGDEESIIVVHSSKALCYISTYKQKGGLQEITKCEGGAEQTLEINENEASVERAGLEGTGEETSRMSKS